MRKSRKMGWAMVSGLLLAAVAHQAPAAQAPDLSGLWAAKLRFGPDIRGPLMIIAAGDGWRADIAGFSVPVQVQGERIAFALPDGKGSFRGVRRGRDIAGHWIQPASPTGGAPYATPVLLSADGADRWRGVVVPLDYSSTFYLPVTRRPEGGFATYLRNPERNQGRFTPVSRIELDGETARLVGRRRGQTSDTVFAEGRYDSANDRLALPIRGLSFDFVRTDGETSSPFYPRGNPAQHFRYTPPPRLDDGWPVATLEEEGISREGIERFVQMLIDMPMDSVSTSQVHSLLIARHGRLVLEEYFHGFDRTVPHDTRSAAKSAASTLIGAAIQGGVPIALDSPVFATMNGATDGLDAPRRAMTLRHLLQMQSGFFCDDSNPDAPGNEDAMQDQEAQPDWYRFTLALPMDRTPGERSIYCSGDANLAGGMLRRLSGEPLPELFDRLLARPLQMGRYHLNLTPTGEAYMGGGGYFVPRDFLKLAQLMVNGGSWNGRRIVSRDWVRQAVAPHSELAGIHYGYLWWVTDMPYQGRTVRAFFAGGNGGQTFVGIPELDLVIGFTGGNYADPALLIPQRVFVPEHILPAVN